MQESPYLKEQEHLVRKFRKIPFLQSFPERQLREILSLSKIRKYESEEKIISEGALDSWIYVILSGEVKVVKKGEEIGRLGLVGDIFGELAVIDGRPRSASVYATASTTCLAMDATRLSRMDMEEQKVFFLVFYRLLSEVLANRLRATSEQLAGVKEKFEGLEVFVEKRWY